MSTKRVFRFLAWCFAVYVAVIQLTGCSGIDISPDGKRVVFPWPRDSTLPPLPDNESPGLNAPLAVMNVDGTGFRYVPNSEGAGPGKWSTSGKFLAYEMDGKLMVITTDLLGAEEVPIEGVNGYVWESSGDVLMIVGWEGERRTAMWYDMPSRRVLRKFELADGPGKDTNMEAVPGSTSFVFADERGLWMITPDQEIQLVKDYEISRFRVSQDGSKIIFSVNSADPAKRMISLYWYSLKTGEVEPIAFPDLVRDINVGTPAQVTEVEVSCFSPDLTKMIVLAVYQSRNPDGSPQARSFLIDIFTKEVTPLWLKGEEGSYAAWSPKGDSFMLWTVVSVPGRVAVSLRWFPADGSLGIPIISAHEKYIPGTSSKVSGGVP